MLSYFSRREIIYLGVVGLGSIATGNVLRAHKTFSGQAPLRVGLTIGMAPEVKSVISELYLSRLSTLTGLPLEITELKHGCFPALAAKTFDAVITSPNFEQGLDVEHSLFGSAPAGPDSSTKLRWFASSEGRHLYSEFFAKYKMSAQPLAVGTDYLGCLSQNRATDLARLRGRTIGTSDYRGRWFTALGMRALEQSPQFQTYNLLRGDLDFSEPLPPSLVAVALQNYPTPGPWSYSLTPGFRTAGHYGIFWNPETWRKLAVTNNQLQSMVGETLQNASSSWHEKEQGALQELSQLAKIEKWHEGSLALLRKRAYGVRRMIAQRSATGERIYQSLG